MNLIKGRTMVGIWVVLMFALLMMTHMAQAKTPSGILGDVIVGNTTANPVPVQDVNNLPKEFVMLSSIANSSGLFGEFFRNFPDGTTAPQAFQVPTGKVLVVTDINVRTNGLTDAVLVFYIHNVNDFHTQFPVCTLKLADASGARSQLNL